MNNRSRIINTGLCKEVDRLPFFLCFGPWLETQERWRKEGLEEGKAWNEGFGFDPGFINVNVNLGFSPMFENEVLEDRGDTQLVRDTMGVVMEVHKRGLTVPRYVECPVKSKEDWDALKAMRLNPDDPARLPENWGQLVKFYNEGDYAVRIGDYPYGLFGTLRELMGVEECLIAFYEQPELVHEIMDYLTDFWISIYEKVLRDVKIDCIHIWEDMSGKGGSLISPKMVREFMVPNYRKIRAFADAHDIPLLSLDTDGDCTELVPVFLESGINIILPFEVAAGSDIADYRRKYPKLCISGGINKQEIAKGRDAIDRELERVREVLEQPGYLPGMDHAIHPEVSWEDFKYFTAKLKEIIGA